MSELPLSPGSQPAAHHIRRAHIRHYEVQHAVRRPQVSARRRARAGQQQQGLQERVRGPGQRGARRRQLRRQPGVRGERAQAQRGQRCGAVQRARVRRAAPRRARAQRQRACASRAGVYTCGSALGRSEALRLPCSCAARGRLCTRGVQRRQAQGCRRPAAALPGDPACPAPPGLAAAPSPAGSTVLQGSLLSAEGVPRPRSAARRALERANAGSGSAATRGRQGRA
jgi:hypothetical protein